MAWNYMTDIQNFVVHHSASDYRTTTAAIIKGWHTDPKKPGGPFQDIGYNFVIEGKGQIVIGRPLPIVGSHAKGVNRISIGCCVVGNNLDPDMKWQPAQVLALRHLWQSVQTLFPKIQLKGHRDVERPGYTECPGLDVRALILGSGV